jgi:NADPH-dependent glutamate synthase beta subunit-like oxidoreductase
MSYRVEIPDNSYWQKQIKCQDACPVGTDARGYVRAVANGDFENAYLIARGPNPLASVCGRICAAPCEVNCRRGDIDKPISIRGLKRFAFEKYSSRNKNERAFGILQDIRRYISNRENMVKDELTAYSFGGKKNNVRIAVIGSGPAGLACAHDLALLGFSPTIYEAENVKGGMLAIGIPDYRLPREIIAAEIDIIEALGVEFKTGATIGEDLHLNELAENYDAVVVAVGAKRSRKLPIPGADHPEIMGGIEFLRAVSLGEQVKLGEEVVVIGGGSVAYDVGRSVLRHEPFDVSRQAKRSRGVREVHLCCLESLEEMPADEIEIIEGEKEGIIRHNSLGPHEIIIENDKVAGVRFKRCLSVFDNQGRFAPAYDENDLTEIYCDTVALSIGQQIDLSFINPERDGVVFNERGFVDVNSDGSTRWPWLFFAGDCAYGARLVIDAVAHGKKVARTIASKLGNIEFEPKIEIDHNEIENYAREASYEEVKRQNISTIEPASRLKSGRPVVEVGYSDKEALTEAGRCLDCGVNTIFNGDMCVLCGGCVDVCPEFCLKIVPVQDLYKDNLYTELSERDFTNEDSAIMKDETRCIRCACCADRCPVGAITMERVTFCEVGL